MGCPVERHVLVSAPLYQSAGVVGMDPLLSGGDGVVLTPLFVSWTMSS
jgi:hypothetical protein